MVFSIPGSSDVLTTWYSAVLGFSSVIALPSSFFRRDEKFSAREHWKDERRDVDEHGQPQRDKMVLVQGLTRIRGRTSVHPAYAHSLRIRSLSLLIGNGAATVFVLGKRLGRLSNP
jgi:hypothetical protein